MSEIDRCTYLENGCWGHGIGRDRRSVVSSGAKPLVGSVFASQGTPWYEEGQQSVSGVAASSQPAIGKEKAENPAFYAKALSAAFHNAANAVLPSVVSITRFAEADGTPQTKST